MFSKEIQDIFICYDFICIQVSMNKIRIIDETRCVIQ